MAKKAVDSTLRRILNYTAEIIIAIILLVTICIPLAFTIPMWFQHVIFDVPRTELTINPAAWFGLDGTLWITLFLGLVSSTLGYLYILKMKPGDTSVSVVDDDEVDDDEEADEEFEETSAESEDEILEDEIPLEDQEADEDIPLEDQEEVEDSVFEEEDSEEESEED
jgi:hypothetical protein